MRTEINFKFWVVGIVFISFFVNAHALDNTVIDEWREVLESTVGEAQIYKTVATKFERKDIFSKENFPDDEARVFLSTDTVIVLYNYQLIGWYFERVSMWAGNYEKAFMIYPINNSDEWGNMDGIRVKGFPMEEQDWVGVIWDINHFPESVTYGYKFILRVKDWDFPIPEDILTGLEQAESKLYFYDAFRIIRKEDGEFSIEHYSFPPKK